MPTSDESSFIFEEREKETLKREDMMREHSVKNQRENDEKWRGEQEVRVKSNGRRRGGKNGGIGEKSYHNDDYDEGI